MPVAPPVVEAQDRLLVNPVNVHIDSEHGIVYVVDERNHQLHMFAPFLRAKPSPPPPPPPPPAPVESDESGVGVGVGVGGEAPANGKQ